MFDSVNFKITNDEAGGVDFLAETSCYIDDVAVHTYSNGEVITGRLDGLRVSINDHQVKVGDGSLCKWYLGNNYQTMGRGDTQRAIERLSDSLHLPMDRATVTRLDIAQNIIVKHPPEVYLNHLGQMKSAKRLQEPTGLYYRQSNGRLCFYDKNREQKSNREAVPELYDGRNVLRYEQRYTGRIGSSLNVPEVTGGLLYDEAFYIYLLDGWLSAYKSIQKINDINYNFKAMRTKQELYKMGVLGLTERAGGQIEMINQINEAAKRGELSKKQAYDLRQAVNDACKIRDGLTAKSDAITELDKKVAEAVKYYR